MTAQERFDLLASQPMEVVGSSDNRSALNSLRQIARHREMLMLLIRRDLKSRYKDSTLGFMWTLVRPLTQLLIYYVVIGKFLSAERGIPDFAIYVFTGLTAYGLFSEIVSGGTASIVGNAGLIKKIYLPREVFPLATVGSALFNFGIQLAILLLATLALGAFPISPELVYFVPGLFVLLIYGTAFGLLLSAVNVYLRDMQYLVEVMMLLLLWASPIVYAWSMVKDVVGEGLRLLVAGLIGIVLLVGAQRVFTRLQGNFAQAL
jgi:ABC-2 type transport system permease protein